MSRPAAIRPATTEEQHRRREREKQDDRPRAGEGTQLLRPAERSRPAQPSDVVGGVGDGAQQEEDADDCPAELERDPAGRGELARNRTDPGADRDHRRRREGEERRASERDPAGREADELREPERQRSRRDRNRRRESERAPPDDAGEDELRSSRVLVRPQCAHGSEQAVDGGGDRERAADPPGDVALHGHDVVRQAVEEAQPDVAGKAAGERKPVGRRRIGVAIAVGLHEPVEREQVREDDGARPCVEERAHRERARPPRFSAPHRPSRRSGAGRSPRATARDSSAPRSDGWRARRSAGRHSRPPRSAARSRPRSRP